MKLLVDTSGKVLKNNNQLYTGELASGVNWLSRTSQFNFINPQSIIYNENTTIDITSDISTTPMNLRHSYWDDDGIRNFTIISNRKVIPLFGNSQYLKTIKCDAGFIIQGDFTPSIFGSLYSCESIIGDIDCTGCWINNPFYSINKLKDVSFVPNCIGNHTSVGRLIFESTALTTNSLVSIANGLCFGKGYTVGFSTSSKELMLTIMGNVSDNLFIIDINGTTSLMDFITNTKGWSVS